MAPRTLEVETIMALARLAATMSPGLWEVPTNIALGTPVEMVIGTDLVILVEIVTRTDPRTHAVTLIPTALKANLAVPALAVITAPGILDALNIPPGIDQALEMTIAPAIPVILAMAGLPLDMVIMTRAGTKMSLPRKRSKTRLRVYLARISTAVMSSRGDTEVKAPREDMEVVTDVTTKVLCMLATIAGHWSSGHVEMML
jgi:hypothetical protein